MSLQSLSLDLAKVRVRKQGLINVEFKIYPKDASNGLSYSKMIAQMNKMHPRDTLQDESKHLRLTSLKMAKKSMFQREYAGQASVGLVAALKQGNQTSANMALASPSTFSF